MAPFFGYHHIFIYPHFQKVPPPGTQTKEGTPRVAAELLFASIGTDSRCPCGEQRAQQSQRPGWNVPWRVMCGCGVEMEPWIYDNLWRLHGKTGGKKQWDGMRVPCGTMGYLIYRTCQRHVLAENVFFFAVWCTLFRFRISKNYINMKTCHPTETYFYIFSLKMHIKYGWDVHVQWYFVTKYDLRRIPWVFFCF